MSSAIRLPGVGAGWDALLQGRWWWGTLARVRKRR